MITLNLSETLAGHPVHVIHAVFCKEGGLARKEPDESPLRSKGSKTRPHYLRQQVACVCPPANLKWIFSDEDSHGGVWGG